MFQSQQQQQIEKIHTHKMNPHTHLYTHSGMRLCCSFLSAVISSLSVNPVWILHFDIKGCVQQSHRLKLEPMRARQIFIHSASCNTNICFVSSNTPQANGRSSGGYRVLLFSFPQDKQTSDGDEDWMYDSIFTNLTYNHIKACARILQPMKGPVSGYTYAETGLFTHADGSFLSIYSNNTLSPRAQVKIRQVYCLCQQILWVLKVMR